MMEFNPKQWHHGYLGVILLIVWYFIPSYWLLIPAIVLIVDEILQILLFGQYGGLLHRLYVKTLYKIKWIKDFNDFLDRLFS